MATATAFVRFAVLDSKAWFDILGELDIAHPLTEEVCMRSFFRGLY